MALLKVSKKRKNLQTKVFEKKSYDLIPVHLRRNQNFPERNRNTLRTPIQQHEGSKGYRKDDVKAAGRIRKEGGSDPMANFKDPIHHRRAWAC